MQVHVYLEGDDLETLVVEIPSADGNLICRFREHDLAHAEKSSPLVAQMPEPTATTVYAKPIGEMPLKVQEEYSKRVQEETDQKREAAARLQATPVEDSGSEGAREPAADANVQLGAVDPVVLDPTEGGDPNAGISVGDKSKSGSKPSGASKR